MCRAVLQGVAEVTDSCKWSAFHHTGASSLTSELKQAHVSAELIQTIHSAANNDAWDQYPDLLTWMLCLGGTFANTESLRAEYGTMLRQSSQVMHGSWQELVGVLQKFIWAETAYEQDVETFYETYVA
jgi:hypothetical protein